MVRRYDSSRRREAASQTRRRILQAALELHWSGITEFGPLAEAAGCSEATVRMHFPTKEALFRSCTRTFAESLTPVDLDALRAIGDTEQRLHVGVRELGRIHEAMFGYAWTSAQLRASSPVLDGEMSVYEGLIDDVSEIIAPPPTRQTVRGLLDFLTWRALRLAGALNGDEATDLLIAILRPLVMSGRADLSLEPQDEDAQP